MPSPLEIILNPVSLLIFALYGALMLWEAAAPGRKLPAVKGWKLRGLVWFAAYYMLASYLPLIWDRYLARYQILNLSDIGLAGGVAAGILTQELLVYWWHRAIHSSDLLWRIFHQMHHSAERLDTFGAFYFSPADMIGWTAIGSLANVLILGLSPQTATIVSVTLTFLAIFTHTSVKTPQWLGYFVQRPESHTVHHGKGVHAYNYAELPIFDILFGTFYNPKKFMMPTGFYQGASGRIADMLLFRDIAMPPQLDVIEGSQFEQGTAAHA